MANSVLFSKYTLNSKLSLKNRIVMAPMTRAMATSDWVPTEAMAEYYARRADAGLIVTEGTIIHHSARGHDCVPGIFNAEQTAAWQRVTDKVHERGGLIFSQLWHVGRVSHPYFLKGELPISASDTAMSGHIPRSNDLEFGMCRAASIAEIKQLLEYYAHAAENVIAAGFDGLEIHAANGYLIDQFLHHHTNLRTDEYGGSIENMARFALEVVDTCAKVIGHERLAIRLSAGAYMNQIDGVVADSKVFAYLLHALQDRKLAYVHTGNMEHTHRFPELNNATMTEFMRQAYQGTLVASGNYNLTTASLGISRHEFDLIAFGRPFIANPDLIAKAQTNTAWQEFTPEMLASLR